MTNLHDIEQAEYTAPVQIPDAAVRDALEWYAEQVQNCRKITEIGNSARNQLDNDGGKRARDAISALSAEQAQGEQRQPIETAPKDGSEILAWRVDCGWFIASYTSLDAFPMTQSELDALDEEDLFSKDWFTQNGHERLEGSEIPTHWMLLPAAPTTEAEA